MYKKTIELYADGYDLLEIAEECLLSSPEEVLEDIKAFKEFSKVMRGTKRFTFNTDFREVIVQRFQNGSTASVYEISNELDLSTSTVSKYIKDAGVQPNKKGGSRDKGYVVIENWDDFDCCPTCNLEHTVRQLGCHTEEDTQTGGIKHAYCSSCSTEWYQAPIGEVIDESGNKEVFMETRKVLWYTIQ